MAILVLWWLVHVQVTCWTKFEITNFRLVASIWFVTAYRSAHKRCSCLRRLYQFHFYEVMDSWCLTVLVSVSVLIHVLVHLHGSLYGLVWNQFMLDYDRSVKIPLEAVNAGFFLHVSWSCCHPTDSIKALLLPLPPLSELRRNSDARRLCVCVCVCRAVTACHISLGGEGDVVCLVVNGGLSIMAVSVSPSTHSMSRRWQNLFTNNSGLARSNMIFVLELSVSAF